MTWQILGALTPWLLIMAGLLWGALELRVRRLVEAKMEQAKEELREEFNPKLMRAGTDAMRALDAVHAHDKELAELGVKANFYWESARRPPRDPQV